MVDKKIYIVWADVYHGYIILFPDTLKFFSSDVVEVSEWKKKYEEKLRTHGKFY